MDRSLGTADELDRAGSRSPSLCIGGWKVSRVPERMDTEVLIVGAGPTGLVLALWLVRLGIRVRIIDKADQPGTTSRALAVQSRTLEFYRQLGIADDVVEAGLPLTAVNLWALGRRAAHLDLERLGADRSPFPYGLIYPQAEHDRFLIDRLQDLDGHVERGIDLIDFDEIGGRIAARFPGRPTYQAAFPPHSHAAPT